MTTPMDKRLSSVGIAIAIILYGSTASRDAAADTDLLGEIIVTARKRAENLQDVPQNIDVFTSNSMENLGIAKLEDYLTLSPSISFISTGPGQQRLFIRGASDGSNPNFGHSSTSTSAFLIDDLPFNYFGHVPDLHLYDIERIEVLNGPQGTLFGPGSLSGAIRVITNKPDPNAFSAGVDFDGGQIDGGANNWTYEGFVNFPLIEGKTALRLSAYSAQDGGYIDNVLGSRQWLNGITSTNAPWAGDNFNTRDTVGARVALLQNFGDDWQATLTGFYQRQQYRGSWEENPSRYGARNVELFGPQGGYEYYRFLDLHVEGDVGIGDLVYVGGYSTQQKRRLYDYSEYAQYSSYASFVQGSVCNTGGTSGTPYSGCNDPYMYATVTGTIQQWSNELRLQSKEGGRAHWTVGAYWNKVSDPYSGFIRLPGLNVNGQEAQSYLSYNPTAKPLPQEYYSDYATYNYIETTEFGDVTFDLDPRWSVEAGIQHFHSTESELTDWASYYYQPKVAILRTNSADKINYKAGVSYKAADHVLLYFSFAQGFRDGDFNYVGASAPASVPRSFSPDTLNNYEFGWKSEMWAGRLLWNVAVYDMQWKNYQVAVNVPYPPFGFHANIGDARIYGIESSVEARPIDGLQLSVSGSYNDSKLKSNTFQNPSYSVVPGERLPEAPYFNINGSARYEWALSDGLKPFTQFTVSHKGDMWNDLRLDRRELQPAYTVGDLRCGVARAGGAWQVEAYVSNLWNSHAVVFADYTALAQPDHPDLPIAPRVFGLHLKYRWGKPG
jgi:iron complex outermembrane recepter protein